MGRGTDPIRLRLDWALHRDRGSFRAFHSLIRLTARKQERAGVTFTGDQPLTKVVFGCIRTVLAPEAFFSMKMEPGKTHHWKYQYRFYTVPQETFDLIKSANEPRVRRRAAQFGGWFLVFLARFGSSRRAIDNSACAWLSRPRLCSAVANRK